MTCKVLNSYCPALCRERLLTPALNWGDIWRDWSVHWESCLIIKWCQLGWNEEHSFFFPANVLYGPLHTKQAVSMFLGAVEEAKKEGGTVVYGGKVMATWDQEWQVLCFPFAQAGLWVNWWRVPDCHFSFLHPFYNGEIHTLKNHNVTWMENFWKDTTQSQGCLWIESLGICMEGRPLFHGMEDCI